MKRDFCHYTVATKGYFLEDGFQFNVKSDILYTVDGA
jgi:hypothetical protein